MNRILFALFALTLSLQCGAAAPPNGFRDVKWGSPPAKQLVKFSGPTSDGLTMWTPPKGSKLPPFMGAPVAEEAYSYDKGKFYEGNVWVDGKSNFEALKAQLTKEYGPPSFANPARDLYKWKWPDKKIEIQLFFNKGRATLTYSNLAI